MSDMNNENNIGDKVAPDIDLEQNNDVEKSITFKEFVFDWLDYNTNLHAV